MRSRVVDRMACVDLPAFPLQLLIHKNPEWRSQPVVVVDRDSPGGTILWLNERARAFRILPGMRYAAALSLCRELRAGEVSPALCQKAVSKITQRLRSFTPHVEPAKDRPGLFWLDARGLEPLYESLQHWMWQIRNHLESRKLDGTVIVGFTRFGSYAVAKVKRGTILFQHPREEAAVARRVELSRLDFDARALATLRKLKIRTVGEFIDLPGEGIARRFGSDVARWHRLAAGKLERPLAPEAAEMSTLERSFLDQPEANAQRLLVIVERLLDRLLQALFDSGRSLVALKVRFVFEGSEPRVEAIRPAEPTLDASLLKELIRLRFESLRLREGAVEIAICAQSSPIDEKQRQLFAEKPRRDLAAANRALARVRAELGDDRVVHARPREAHLPEARFRWKPLERIPIPAPRRIDDPRLVRRLYQPSVLLPARPRHEPDGWLLHGLEQGPVVRVVGPYVVSGGWWQRTVRREYHFAETRQGDWLWVYYDRMRRRWFLQGQVE